MIDIIYLEEEVREHPRTLEILDRFPQSTVIPCKHYKEVFNPSAQNFRLQKKKPALILAKQSGKMIHPIPPTYGVGGQNNFYFSHMLNCLYDCRYCFLQGMYPSAHYLLFVNFEDFKNEIEKETHKHATESWFFSGYDCDSLAMEAVTGFADDFLPFFQNLPKAWIELRTKSVVTQVLQKFNPLPNAVVAYSFTPDEISKKVELGVPSVKARIQAMKKVADHGWKIGLRIDPIIDCDDFENRYSRLFENIFSNLDERRIHSVSMGMFRLPVPFFKKIDKLYPEEPLLAGNLESRQGKVTFRTEVELEKISTCENLLLKYIDKKVLFCC